MNEYLSICVQSLFIRVSGTLIINTERTERKILLILQKVLDGLTLN